LFVIKQSLLVNPFRKKFSVTFETFSGLNCSFSVSGDYDKELPPSPVDPEKCDSTYVGVLFDVLDVVEVDDNAYTVTVFLQVAASWEDPRIKINDFEGGMLS